MLEVLHYIDGDLVPSSSGAWLDNVEPATARVYSRLARGEKTDAERAIDAARRAFPRWSATPVEERARLLTEIAARIERDLERFARAESVDTGKPLALSRTVDIPRSVRNLRFFAGAIEHFASESHATDQLAINYTLRRARGVAGCISPWNLPLYLFTWKIAPALAAGNTVVGKPSELTPVTASMLAEVCHEVGLPPGVLNVVHGLGAEVGATITAHPDVGTISFTGGTRTGQEIARTCAPMFKKVALEMGGKNATIVFADADLEAAVTESVRAAFTNQGQVCLCGSRVLVERAVHDEFLDRFLAATSRLSPGDPLEPATSQGALVSRAHLDKVLGYIELATREGGTIACGGGPPEELPQRCRDGFFLQPTVVTGLDAFCRTNREEIFGPVVTVMPFDRESEAVAWTNATSYGLAASLWTSDLARAHRLADAIEAGTVWINCWMLRDLRVPFGGMKHSGVGREGGQEILRFFTEPKNVCLRYTGGDDR